MSQFEALLRPILANRVIAWLIFGWLAFWALSWQIRLLKKDYAQIRIFLRYPTWDSASAAVPHRVRSTFSVCFLIGLGVIVEAFLSVQAGFVRNFPTDVVIAQLLALIPLFAVVGFKSFWGPVFTVGALAFAIYFYIQVQVFMVPPFMEALFDFAASLLPPAWEQWYVAGFTVYALVTSWSDTWSTT